jgi:MFS transporter, UMF1 family
MVPAVSRREIWAWAGFDFANSSFTTVMITVLFPVYFTQTLGAGRQDAAQLWGFAGSFSNLIVVLLSPWLGAWADRHGAKKKVLGFTWVLCFIPTIALAFVAPAYFWIALVLFILANVGFALGENFCASFLPEISTPATAGRVSSYGWALGYLGGLVSLLLALSVSPAQGILITGLFFFVAALPTFIFLRERALPQVQGFERSLAPWHTWRKLGSTPALGLFLGSFFFASAGLSTVVYFAGIFAVQELGMTPGELQMMFLALQFSAAAGALSFGWWMDRLDARLVFGASLLLWVGVALGCYFTTSIKTFYLVAALAGVGLGATQACARAMVSQWSGPAQAGEFFGWWGLAGKLAPVISLPIFGSLASGWGLRPALLSTLLFFMLALIMLTFVLGPKAKRDGPAQLVYIIFGLSCG